MKRFEWQTIGCVLLSIALTVLGCIAAPASSFAKAAEEDNCPTVDLRNDYVFLNTSRDQKETAWCYSYSGSDLVSAKLGHPVSSFDLALRISLIEAKQGHFDPHHLVLIDGASIGAVEELVQREGVCSANKFNSDHPLAIEALTEAENLANFVQQGKTKKQLSDLQIQKLVFAHSQILHYIFPTTDIWSLSSFFKKIGLKDKSPLIRVVDQVCARDRIKADLDFDYDESKNKLEIAKALLQDHHIVEIGYVARQLRDLSVPFKNIEDIRHASSLIGMRFNKFKNKCEFLVRNSYGDRARLLYDSKLRTQVNNANIWIDEDLAKKIVFEVSWIY